MRRWTRVRRRAGSSMWIVASRAGRRAATLGQRADDPGDVASPGRVERWSGVGGAVGGDVDLPVVGRASGTGRLGRPRAVDSRTTQSRSIASGEDVPLVVIGMVADQVHTTRCAVRPLGLRHREAFRELPVGPYGRKQLVARSRHRHERLGLLAEGCLPHRQVRRDPRPRDRRDPVETQLEADCFPRRGAGDRTPAGPARASLRARRAALRPLARPGRRDCGRRRRARASPPRRAVSGTARSARRSPRRRSLSPPAAAPGAAPRGGGCRPRAGRETRR